MTPLPQSIDDVLIELDKIIEASIENGDYLAIFAYVYRRTTAQIKAEILAKSFDDNERMERMDVTFANRYLDAYRQFANDKTVSASWLVAFKARFQKRTIMQHLLVGMSAHINFDLGIAAAETAQGQDITDLKNDFMKVNEILADLTNEMQLRVARASKLMFLLDWIGGKSDEKIANYSIKKARQFAWKVATTLTKLDGGSKKLALQKFDDEIAKLNRAILNPRGKILNFVLKIISFFEEKKIKKIVENLKAD
jgi:Family of unknown function (DUF5995)